MPKRSAVASWLRLLDRGVAAIGRSAVRTSRVVAEQAIKPVIDRGRPPPGAGDWIAGAAMGLAGVRRYWLYRPPKVRAGERLPLMVMLHGCGQTAKSFALSTRMNRIAARERFMVLYPEQDRTLNAGGCWNWFDTRSGRAYAEAALIMKAVDQVCLLYQGDRRRIAVAGISAGASMAGLLATRHPARFKAVVMHSGVPPGTAHSAISGFGAMQGLRATRPLPGAPVALTGSWPPLMVIHGSRDLVVSVSNGHAAAQAWAKAFDARASVARSVRRGQRHEMTVTDYRCRGRTVATLVEVGALGHAWSGGAAKQPFSDARGPDASRMAWTFAARQFRAGEPRSSSQALKKAFVRR